MKLNAEDKAELLSILILIKNTMQRRAHYGICFNVVRLTYIEHKNPGVSDIAHRYICWITRKSRKWPKYSGVKEYPVPSSSKMYSPKGAYDRACLGRTMWKGRYGRLRFQLLNFLVRELKQEIKK